MQLKRLFHISTKYRLAETQLFLVPLSPLQVRDFFHILIKVHKCDPDMVKSLSFRLGARHRRYMTEVRRVLTLR